MITYLDRVCFGTVAPEIQREFGLSDTQKGVLFSAFALAYAAFEVPSGWLGDVYGPKRTLIRIVLAWSLFTALTGLIYPAMLGMQLAFLAMVAIRFLFGAGEAGAYPNIARAFHNWFPFSERGFAKGAVWMAGRFAGGITAFIVLAMMFKTDVNGQVVTHWRHIFWIFGILGILWCFAFWMWFKDRPEQSDKVNQAELNLIRGDQAHDYAHAVTTPDADPHKPMPVIPRLKVPWGELFSSPNLWMLCLMYFCAAYGWYFNITYLPGYLTETFGETRGEVWSANYWRFSLMAGAPLLLGSVACLAGGWLSDLFIKKTGNRKWGRRFFGVIGHALCAACYFLAILADNAWLFVLAIAMAAFWNDMTMGAAWASCLDIGRRYSGIVAGCMNTVGNLGGFVAGFLSGYILDAYPGNKATGWTINFIIFGSVYVLAVFFWMRFDSTKPVARDA